MASTWSWLSKRREHEVITRCIKHMEIIEKEVRSFLQELHAMEQLDIENVKRHYETVFQTERDADKIKQDIIDDLSKGMIHPISREELIRLILTSDDVANSIKAAARRLTLIRPPYIPQDVTRLFIEMTEKIDQQITILKEAVTQLGSNPSKSIEKAEKVERLEEEIDDIRITAELKVLEMCNKTRTSLCLITYTILDLIEAASDRAEDVGDVIRSIALST